MIVYRVQDKKGRGPFKPGKSKLWADECFAPGQEDLPTWGDEFGWDLIDRLGQPGEFFGSGVVRHEDIARWFSTTEQERLDRLGYRPVQLFVDRVLAESSNQVVFARKRPLHRQVARVPWTSP